MSASMKIARRSSVIGTARSAPSAPRRNVHTTSDMKVISPLSPTEFPTMRGWMNVWIVTLRTL